MATQTSTKIVDDFDGAPATTITFGLDGTTYEIDLTDQRQNTLRAGLAPFIEKGRKVTSKRRSPATTTTHVGPAPATVRAWARANNIEVPDRGRVSQSVIDQFNLARR